MIDEIVTMFTVFSLEIWFPVDIPQVTKSRYQKYHPPYGPENNEFVEAYNKILKM